MSIKPVSGKIESKPINDNFSYLDSKIETVSGGPGGFFNTVAELKAAYPNGSDRFFVIGGYAYWWKGNEWVKGDIYQAVGLQDRQVSLVKRTEVGMVSKLILSGAMNLKIEVDTELKTITFPIDTIIIWAKSAYPLPANVVLDYSAISSSALKIVFDTITKSLTVYVWSYALSESEILIAVYRSNRQAMDISVPYFVDGNYMGRELTNAIGTNEIKKDSITYDKRTDLGANVSILSSGTSTVDINISTTDKTMNIPTDTIFIWGNNYHVVTTQTIVDYSTVVSTALKFIFNTESKTFYVIPYSGKEKDNELVFATFRTNNKKVAINAPCLVDGRTPGVTEKQLKILASSSGKALNFDTVTQNLVVYSDTLFMWDNFQRSTGALNKTISYSGLGTTAIVFVYNILNGDISAKSFSAQRSGYEIIFATMRTNGLNIDCSALYTINDKPFGLDRSSASSIINEHHDRIKNSHHRGSNFKYPESTLPAYKKSYEEGTRIIEIDLSWTLDNVPVVLHDITINRTARNPDGTKIDEVKNITDITYAEARSYDYGVWKDPKFKGTLIPSFEEIVELCVALNMHVYIDRASVMTLAQWEILKVIINKYDAINIMTFMIGAGSTQLTDKMRLDYPNCSFMILAFSDVTDTAIAACKVLKTDKGHCFLFPEETYITETQVRKAVSEGLEVRLWNNSLATDYRKLIDWGIRGFQTDGYNVKELIINKF